MYHMMLVETEVAVPSGDRWTCPGGRKVPSVWKEPTARGRVLASEVRRETVVENHLSSLVLATRVAKAHARWWCRWTTVPMRYERPSQ